MTGVDIVERLWDRHIELDSCRIEDEEDIFSEAAGEIERLREQVKNLSKSLSLNEYPNPLKSL